MWEDGGSWCGGAIAPPCATMFKKTPRKCPPGRPSSAHSARSCPFYFFPLPLKHRVTRYICSRINLMRFSGHFLLLTFREKYSTFWLHYSTLTWELWLYFTLYRLGWMNIKHVCQFQSCKKVQKWAPPQPAATVNPCSNLSTVRGGHFSALSTFTFNTIEQF